MSRMLAIAGGLLLLCTVVTSCAFTAKKYKIICVEKYPKYCYVPAGKNPCDVCDTITCKEVRDDK